MTINNKSERNYRGKCLGWPVTSYGAAGLWMYHTTVLSYMCLSILGYYMYSILIVTNWVGTCTFKYSTVCVNC